jgi:hypothetical protein
MSAILLLVWPLHRSDLKMEIDEHLYFQTFCEQIAPALSGAFDSDIWRYVGKTQKMNSSDGFGTISLLPCSNENI